MEVVKVPRLQLNVETNVKFSSNRKKYGPPPKTVMVGGTLRVEFEVPAQLLRGVYLEKKYAGILVNNVPGFKHIVGKGSSHRV